jgi:hypothetical protein
MKVDFAKFEHSLPYASELYGIYQPLLGWRSRMRSLEVAQGMINLKKNYLQELQINTRPVYELPSRALEFKIGVGQRVTGRSALDAVDSIVARRVGKLVAEGGGKPAAWHKFTSPEVLEEILADSRDEIQKELTTVMTAHAQSGREVSAESVLSGILERESTVTGALAQLRQERSPVEIAELMKSTEVPSNQPFYGVLEMLTPAQSDLVNALISPIGLVRLYRQYFFEFDTFLGPPVQHLWLSPGGLVELVETSTRRTLIERTTEQAFESIEKAEKSSTTEDELSDAVRSENGANTKLGVTLNSTGTYGVAGFVDGSTTVGSSLNVEESSKDAREKTHRALRQQTEKLSSEIRKSFKSTFKTVTETTDTQSRRYVINNTTKKLLNYELRRKMRQVGVQVQDYGLQLCWQAYVNKPGDELGVAKLVHVAAPADLQGVKEPDAPVVPAPEIRDKPFSIRDLHFGTVTDSPIGPGFIALTGRLQLTAPPGYVYSRAEVARTNNEDYATLRAYPQDSTEAVAPGLAEPPEVTSIPTGDVANPSEPSVRSIVIGWLPTSVRYGDGHNYYWDLEVTVIWKPSQQHMKDSDAAYKSAMKLFTAEKERVYREALHKATRDRIKAASNIELRKFEELREEERIVIYRNLIRTLLDVAGITTKDPKVRHVFAELVQSMFDVDKMLYFVAPEWWMPRPSSYSQQNIGLHPSNSLERVGKAYADFDKATTVDWGGGSRKSDYYITEDSTRARLGSSLGWVLQLDGDNLRNAFLNAPWVKAVIPIRAGHEWKALEWLSSDAIEGSDGLEARYEAANNAERVKILGALKAHVWHDANLTSLYAGMNDPDKIRIIDAIRYLILHIQERHAKSLETVPDPDDATMNYLPTDEVFERGFDPLQGGFKAAGTKPFKVFDQWVEVLPTDQIVPVEVEYDPKTGMQI